MNVSIHSYGLIFGQMETGAVVMDGLRGVRRPGTSRLSAGGFVALSMRGGSVSLTNSELSYNFDDLTDIQSGLAFAFAQVLPTTISQIFCCNAYLRLETGQQALLFSHSSFFLPPHPGRKHVLLLIFIVTHSAAFPFALTCFH